MTFGVSIIALAALAGSIFFARLSIPRVNLFNPWMVSAGFALVFYVLPLLIYGVDPDIYTEAPDLLREQVSAATLWTLLFYTAVFVGQAVGERIRVFQNTFDWRRSEFMEDRTLLTAGIIIYSLAWPARALIISQGVYIQSGAEEVSNVLLVSYAKILEELYIVGFLLIGAAYYKAKASGQTPGRLSKLFPSLCVLELVFALPSGRKETVLLIPLLVLYLHSYFHGGIRRSTILLWTFPIAALVTAYALVNYTYRVYGTLSMDELGGAQTTRTVGGLIELASTASAMLWIDPNSIFEVAWIQTINRIGGFVEPLFFILAQTPNIIDYKFGATLNPLLAIPRFIWPDKPITAHGNDLGHEYGLVRLDDPFTSISFSAPAEAYMNFGYAGLLVGFMIGFFFMRAHKFFLGSSNNTPLSAALYFPIFLAFMLRMHSGLFAALDGAVKLLLVVGLVFYTVRVTKKAFTAFHSTGSESQPL